MPETVTRESPLARYDVAARSAQAHGGERFSVRERALLGHLNLRGSTQDPRFVSAVQQAIGVAPPVAPNTVVDAQAGTMYWLGPDEWLLVTAGERRASVETSLRAALTEVRHALTDVSGGQTVVVLEGTRVRDVLAKGCPLDLHRRNFGDGQCAQTHLAKAPILIRPIDREAAYEIVVRRSFADYFWVWLTDAAAEYRLDATA